VCDERESEIMSVRERQREKGSIVCDEREREIVSVREIQKERKAV